MEREEKKEKVSVPVHHQEDIHEEEIPKEPPEKPDEMKVWEIPRRWRVY